MQYITTYVKIKFLYKFYRDMIQKLRRQSVKASGIKGKLGLGGKPNTYRSRSFIVPSPTLENQLESPEDMNLEVNSANSASYESSPRSGPSRYRIFSLIKAIFYLCFRKILCGDIY